MKPKAALAVLCLGLLDAPPGVAAAEPAGPPAPPARRVYPHLLEPREHPDYQRRHVQPPNWDTFGRRTQFTCLRGFNVEKDLIVGYREEIEKFSRRFELGDVIWPSYPILFAKNLGDLADEIKRQNLYLFDVWGYVPGSGPGGYWQQFKPPAAAFRLLEAKLGERWLGTDIGEQDGRYIGGYANQMTPASASRLEQYLNFQRHFERMGDDLGHKHATLVSLNFGHYFLKEGTYTLIGAETAQALPNSQVYYAFIRGAGKQYGVPWFGNASIFNRWGYKVYGSSGRSEGYDFGPTKGTSLSLMKRLLYSHILYNCVAVGFENGWLEGDKLSPLGQIQQAAQRWIKTQGQPGVLHTPVALLLDFYAGWTFPRHLYTDKVYRVWGNLPYAPGDYFTDAVLDLLYPGYQNASYYHDESGFLTPTPYGDIADALLSDAPLWLLERYPVVIVAGELGGGHELRDKLAAYVQEGGHLVMTSRALAALPGGLGGTLKPRADAAPWLEAKVGKGTLTVLETPFGVALGQGSTATGGDAPVPTLPELAQLGSGIDRPLPKPYSLPDQVRGVLDRVLRSQMLFEAGPGLCLITCRKGPGEYTVGVLNNSWQPLPLELLSHCGPIASLRELPLDRSETGAVGYTPEGIDATKLGANSAHTIAGGDVRMFAVRVQETNVLELPHVPPPARPHGRFLTLRRLASLKEAILMRPTFFEHFDGVVADWRYLKEHERTTLEHEAGWLRRQGLRIVVDLSSSLDLYPGLRLVDNDADDYAASLASVADVLAKMEALDARDLLLSLHRHPENNFTGQQTQAAFDKTLKSLAGQAAQRRITLHLRLAFGKPPWNLAEALAMLDRVGAANLKLAPSLALLSASQTQPASAAPRLKGRVGLWLASAPATDAAGKLWNAHGRLHEAPHAIPDLPAWLALAPDAPLALDAVYDTPDEEYLDIRALERLTQ